MTLFRLKAIWTTSFVCALLSLGGCISTDISDLDRYISDVLARPGGRIKPLPEIKPYEAYAYQSEDMDSRDPFRLFYQKYDYEFIEEEDSGLTN